MPEQITHQLVKTLRAVPDFADFDDAGLVQLVGTSANLFWSAGSTIFSPGDPAEALYVVLSGSARILDGDAEVARIAPGDYFGEHALLRHASHSRTAEADEDSELMVIPRDSLESLLADNPSVAAHLQRRVENRDA